MVLHLNISYYSVLLKTELCPRHIDTGDCSCYFIFCIPRFPMTHSKHSLQTEGKFRTYACCGWLLQITGVIGEIGGGGG